MVTAMDKLGNDTIFPAPPTAGRGGIPSVGIGIPPTPNHSPDPRLQIWLSPAFPSGGFAYSHGLEWAVEAGDIRGLASAIDWLDALLEHGAPRNDCILLAAAWRSAAAGDGRVLSETNELALALAGSAERYLETSQQGTSFLLAVRAAWPTANLEQLVTPAVAAWAYPVAVGACAGAHALSLEATLATFATAAVNNLVSALIRLGCIGQTDGQRAMAALLDPIARLASAAAHAGLDDLGQAAFRSDLAALLHETQYTRLFRS